MKKTVEELTLRCFRNRKAPVLLYANRQDFRQDRHERPMHRHDKICELLLCYYGNGIYHVDDQSFPVREGDLIYYNGGEHHELLSLPDKEIGTYCLGFGEVSFPDLPRHAVIPASSAHVRPSGSLFLLLRELAEQILECGITSPEDQILMQSLGISFLLTARKIPAGIPAGRRDEEAYKVTARIKEYINEHYTENLKISDIAGALSFSESHVSHVFQRCTGYSPMQYAIRCRIGYAQTLLISSDRPVTQIAMDVGYDNANYFQTLFRRIVGTTPVQYRKQYLKNLHGEREQL